MNNKLEKVLILTVLALALTGVTTAEDTAPELIESEDVIFDEINDDSEEYYIGRNFEPDPSTVVIAPKSEPSSVTIEIDESDIDDIDNYRSAFINDNKAYISFSRDGDEYDFREYEFDDDGNLELIQETIHSRSSSSQQDYADFSNGYMVSVSNVRLDLIRLEDLEVVDTVDVSDFSNSEGIDVDGNNVAVTQSDRPALYTIDDSDEQLELDYDLQDTISDEFVFSHPSIDDTKAYYPYEGDDGNPKTASIDIDTGDKITDVIHEADNVNGNSYGSIKQNDILFDVRTDNDFDSHFLFSYQEDGNDYIEFEDSPNQNGANSPNRMFYHENQQEILVYDNDEKYFLYDISSLQDINSPPSINSIETTPEDIELNDNVDVTANVTDDDENLDTVEFTVSKDGTEINSEVLEANGDFYTVEDFFTADEVGDYVIEVTGTDTEGDSTTDSITKSVTFEGDLEPEYFLNSNINGSQYSNDFDEAIDDVGTTEIDADNVNPDTDIVKFRVRSQTQRDDGSSSTYIYDSVTVNITEGDTLESSYINDLVFNEYPEDFRDHVLEGETGNEGLVELRLDIIEEKESGEPVTTYENSEEQVTISFVDAELGLLDSIQVAITDGIEDVIDTVTGLIDDVISVLNDLLGSIIDAIDDGVSGIVDLIIDFILTIIEVLLYVVLWTVQVIVDIITSIIVGILNTAQYLVLFHVDVDYEYQNETYESAENMIEETDLTFFDIIIGESRLKEGTTQNDVFWSNEPEFTELIDHKNTATLLEFELNRVPAFFNVETDEEEDIRTEMYDERFKTTVDMDRTDNIYSNSDYIVLVDRFDDQTTIYDASTGDEINFLEGFRGLEISDENSIIGTNNDDELELRSVEGELLEEGEEPESAVSSEYRDGNFYIGGSDGASGHLEKYNMTLDVVDSRIDGGYRYSDLDFSEDGILMAVSSGAATASSPDYHISYLNENLAEVARVEQTDVLSDLGREGISGTHYEFEDSRSFAISDFDSTGETNNRVTGINESQDFIWTDERDPAEIIETQSNLHYLNDPAGSPQEYQLLNKTNGEILFEETVPETEMDVSNVRGTEVLYLASGDQIRGFNVGDADESTQIGTLEFYYPKVFDDLGWPFGSIIIINIVFLFTATMAKVLPDFIVDGARALFEVASLVVNTVITVLLLIGRGINWLFTDGAEMAIYAVYGFIGVKLIRYYEMFVDRNLTGLEVIEYIYMDVLDMFDRLIRVLDTGYLILFRMFDVLMDMVRFVKSLIPTQN